MRLTSGSHFCRDPLSGSEVVGAPIRVPFNVTPTHSGTCSGLSPSFLRPVHHISQLIFISQQVNTVFLPRVKELGSHSAVRAGN